MLRNSMLSLAALSFAAFSAASASAGTYGANGSYGDAIGSGVEQVTHKCHVHWRVKTIKVIVGYDYYNNPIYKKRIKYRKFCHKHYQKYYNNY